MSYDLTPLPPTLLVRVCGAACIFAGAALLAAFALWWRLTGPAPPALLPPAGEVLHATLPFRFAMVSDSQGNGSVFERILKRIKRDRVGLILHTGDFVTRTTLRHFGWVLHELDEEQLGVPFCAAPGNHDTDKDAEDPAASYAAYNRAFGPRHYWFVYANTLFVALDTATGRLSNDELEWLDNTLTQHRPERAACFVFTHFPPRDPRPGSSSALKEGAEALGALLKKHRVTALFAGHIHAYFEDKVEGVPVFIAGGAGGELEKGFSNHHYLVCTVEADGTLKCQRNDVGGGSDEDLMGYQFHVNFPATAAVTMGAVLLASGVALTVWRRKRARLHT